MVGEVESGLASHLFRAKIRGILVTGICTHHLTHPIVDGRQDFYHNNGITFGHIL